MTDQDVRHAWKQLAEFTQQQLAKNKTGYLAAYSLACNAWDMRGASKGDNMRRLALLCCSVGHVV